LLDVALTIETLSISNAAHADRRPANASSDQSLAGLEEYHIIGKRNLFRPGEPPASLIKLSAITSDVQKKARLVELCEDWRDTYPERRRHVLT
jgi:hypothetical protein